MKKEITYQVSTEVKELLHRWLLWLQDERRYSAHTLDAYARDVAIFFDFLYNYHEKKLCSLTDLEKLEVHDFRAFLSHRNTQYIAKSSKKFFSLAQPK